MAVQQAQPFEHQVVRHHGHLEGLKHQDDIDQKQPSPAFKRKGSEGPGRRKCHQKLTGHRKSRLQAGIPEHHIKARRVQQQLHIGL